MTSPIERKISIGFAAALLVFLVISAALAFSARSLIETRQALPTMQMGSRALESFGAMLVQVENAQLGYLMRGDAEDLAAFESLGERLMRRLAEVRRLLIDHP